jgi:hypothetical protein
VVIGQNFWDDCCDLGEWLGCSAGEGWVGQKMILEKEKACVCS